MKKVFAILAMISALPISSAFAAGTATSEAVYSGNVEEQCVIQTQLTPSDLRFIDTNGDGFSDAVEAYSEFGYQSNTDCAINSSSVVTFPPALDPNGAEITQNCSFPGGGTTLIANNAYTRVDSSVTFKGNNRNKALPAGQYSVTCKIAVSL